MNAWPARGAALALLTLGACSNPLGPIGADYIRRPSTDRLRSIDRLDPDRYARPAPASAAATGGSGPVAAPASPRYVDRFAGQPGVRLSIEDARAAVLERNLDLRAALVEPTIRLEALRAEEARFEAVFRPSVAYRDVDQPTPDVTQPNQQRSTTVGAGVDIPLRTGGRASVDFAGSRSETSNPFFTFNTAYDTAVTFSLSQPLLRNAGRRASTYAIRLAATDRDISEARAKLEVIRQLAAADRAYWRLYAARQGLEVRQKQYELAQAQLERARRRVDAGDAPPLEVTRAEAGAASQLDQIIQAERAVLDAQRALKLLINLPELDVRGGTSIEPATAPDPVRFDVDVAALADLAVDNRMEMLELELQLAQDFAGIEFAKNQALPLFTLDFAYSIPGLSDRLAPSLDQLSSAEFSTWQMGVSGQIPIGNEAAKARVQQAILTRLQRLSTRDARRQAIQAEVAQSVDALEAAWQRILASRQAVILAAATLEGEQRQFEAGARTSTEVLDAAARLADEQTGEVRALAEYQIAQVDLAFATGTLIGASRVFFSPEDPRIGRPAGGDPTPFVLPFYDDPERAPTRADWEVRRAREDLKGLVPGPDGTSRPRD
jgi:outer membrane protein TolC